MTLIAFLVVWFLVGKYIFVPWYVRRHAIPPVHVPDDHIYTPYGWIEREYQDAHVRAYRVRQDKSLSPQHQMALQSACMQTDTAHQMALAAIQWNTNAEYRHSRASWHDVIHGVASVAGVMIDGKSPRIF